MQNVDGVGAAKGVYAPQMSGTTLSVSADVRTLRYSNSDPATVLPWQDGAAAVGMFTANPASAPFASIYASSTTHGWRFSYTGDAAISPDIDDYDLGAPALLDEWYRVELTIDRQAGSFRSQITDIASGVVVVDNAISYANYQPSFDSFDSILFAPAESSATLPPGGLGATTVANIMQLDNVNLAPVPEPETFAMMLAGLAAGSLVLRRRQA